MTTNYHTPMSGADLPLALISWNTRFSDLDSAITGLANGNSNTVSVTLGESVSIRQAGYIDLSDNEGYLLDADSASPKAGAIRGFWTATASSGASNTLQISGVLDGFTGLTVGEPVYVDTTSGAITQTRPSPSSGGTQIAVMQMGIALSATEVLVRPLPIQYQKRDAMADTDTMSVVHHGDTNGYLRKIFAYITETVSGAAAEEYTSGNQDSDVSLRDRAVATYGSDETTGGTASASSEFSGSTTADLGFNGNTGNRWSSSAGGAQWLKYQFGSSATKTIRRYTIRHYSAANINNAPDSWTFEGSNNDSDWTVLDTISSEPAWTAGEQRTYNIDNSTAYEYYRLNFTATEGGSLYQISDVEMFEAATYTDGDDKLAQTFTLSGSTDIASVGLWLKKVGSPTGTATVRIETVSGSNPTGTLADAAATITFAESGLGTSYAEKLLTFASQFTLAAGTYAIVLSTDRAASESNYIQWGADGSSPSYAGGDMRSELSSTWSAESKDAVFSVNEPGATHPSRVSVDWWSSSYADMVNRYGDGAGASLDSQTTFKCVRSAGFSDITVVVELP